MLRDGWEDITKLVREHLLSMEVLLRGEVAALDDALADVAGPMVRAGGKRVRPLVLLLAAAMGRPPWAKAHAAACAVEMVHTASLIHDDVLDDAQARRGLPTICATVGTKKAVLAGDVLYCRALETCLREGLHHLAFLLAGAARHMSEAEALQTAHNGDLAWPVSEYVEVVRRKTGTLFGAAAAAGAHLTGRAEYEKALGRFGLHLGTAFQMVDDVLDYVPQRPGWGKDSLSDLRQRKATLPMLIARETGGLAGWPSPSEAYGALRDCGALERALATAREEAGLARSELRGVPHGPAQEALSRLTVLVVERTELW